MAKVEFSNEEYTPLYPSSDAQLLEEQRRRQQIFDGQGAISTQTLRSRNFVQTASGWFLGSSGDAEFNGNKLTSTNFTKVFAARGVSFYVSDGTTPNGNLSGTAGDICLNGPSGQPFYCGGGTTWTGM